MGTSVNLPRGSSVHDDTCIEYKTIDASPWSRSAAV